MKRVGAPGGSRTRKIQFLRLTRMPIPSPGLMVDGVGVAPTPALGDYGFTDRAGLTDIPLPSLSWGAGRDSNPKSASFEEDAFTDFATGPETYLSRYRKCRWSGRWDSNPRHLASETSTLPTELRPEVGGRGRMCDWENIMVQSILRAGKEVKPCS